MEQNEVKQDSIVGSTLQVADTINMQKSSNEIRFDGWGRNDWLDNEYIRTLRKYLDDYNVGKVSNSDLDPYKEQIKGQFVVYNIEPYLLGGVFICEFIRTSQSGRNRPHFGYLWGIYKI